LISCYRSHAGGEACSALLISCPNPFEEHCLLLLKTVCDTRPGDAVQRDGHGYIEENGEIRLEVSLNPLLKHSQAF
jgi:hypothetical protein